MEIEGHIYYEGRLYDDDKIYYKTLDRILVKSFQEVFCANL